MDYDDHIFKEVVNDTVGVVDLADTPNQYVAEEIILLIFGLMGMAANILLIYIICYFRKLHTTTNIYLINWAIADCGSALITLTFFGIFDLEVPHEILCFYVGLAFALIFNEMLFMIMLTMDWCLSSYLPRPLDKFRQFTKYIVAAAWVVAALYSLASSLLCSSVSSYYLIFHITLPIAYAALFFFVIVLHCIRIVQKLRKKFEYHPMAMLILPTAFVLCGFLSWANLLFLDLPESFYMLTETPAFLHPTINLLLLVIYNDDFKLCFFQVIKCSSCKLFKFKPSSENIEASAENSSDQAISFDNKTFDHLNRHI